MRGAVASAASRIAQADRRACDISPLIAHWREAGCSLREICRLLLERGIRPPRASHWSPSQVARTLERAR
jgi:hypothetical protein